MVASEAKVLTVDSTTDGAGNARYDGNVCRQMDGALRPHPGTEVSMDTLNQQEVGCTNKPVMLNVLFVTE